MLEMNQPPLEPVHISANVSIAKEGAMERANIGDTTLAFELVGRGQPVVLVHGAVIADAFSPLTALSAVTDACHVLRYHRRGYGASAPTPGPASVKQHADDCRATGAGHPDRSHTGA
jgi:pimeloyl-ACP methyl ester carboxylesterase